jgi:hypothetical protein
MYPAGRHDGTGGKPALLLLAWVLAVFIVGVAVFGPSLTGRRIPALVEIRHAILMIDREFERWPTRADIYGGATMIRGGD